MNSFVHCYIPLQPALHPLDLPQSGLVHVGVPGVIYKIDPALNYTVLFTFYSGGYRTPFSPEGDLILDAAGNIYGTTQYSTQGAGGAVFELEPTGRMLELYTYPGGLSESPPSPNPGVIQDPFGNLYGVTSAAGPGGMVFKIAPSHQETTLYTFAGAPGGTEAAFAHVIPPLIRDAAGNFYGTTLLGGESDAGIVYRLSPSGQETVLYNFSGEADGYEPQGIVRDSTGNIYGITSYGGGISGLDGHGVVYKLDTAGNYIVLHTFTGEEDGGLPSAIILDAAGNPYGTTIEGGTVGAGVVFKMDPSGHETVQYSFTGGSDGYDPLGGIALDWTCPLTRRSRNQTGEVMMPKWVSNY